MKYVFTLLATSFLTSAFAQIPNLHWTYQNDGKSYAEDRGICIAFDPAGNIITAGYLETGCSEIDIHVIKYSPTGDTLFSVTYDGSTSGLESDEPRALTIDGLGNIYVTGMTEEAAFPYAVTLKYDPSGNLLWANRYLTAESTGNDIAVDGSGNVYICGYREISNSRDYLLIKYNAAGAQQWMQNYSNGNYDEAISLEVTPTGDVYVTGKQSGVNFLFDWATVKYNTSGGQQWVDVFTNVLAGYSEEPAELILDNAGDIYVLGTAPLSSQSNRDYYLIKYNSSGGRIWEFTYNNTALNFDEYPVDMTVDATGNTYITGNVIYNPGGQDINIIKVNSSGQFVWETHVDSIAQTDYARSIELSPAGDYIYVAGDITVDLINPVGRDIILMMLDTAGNEIVRLIQDGPGNNFDLPYDLAVNANGQIAVTGMQSMNSEWNANGDESTMLLDQQLTPLWTSNFNGNAFANDFGVDMVVDPSGNAYVCGNTRGGEVTLEDLVVFKTNPSGQRLWEYVYRGSEESSSEIAVAINIDSQQNVYVTGTTDTSTGINYRNIYTVKLSPTGQVLWERFYNGTAGGMDYPSAILTDNNGNVYVSGTAVNSGTGFDGIILCYDASGNLIWANPFDAGSQGESFLCMSKDAQNNLYAAGFLNPASGAMSDGLLVKYDAAGTILWDTAYDFSSATNDRDFFNSIAMDNAGNVFVAGQSNLDFVAAKYTPAGLPSWIQNYSHSSFVDSATTIAVDIFGDVIVGGTFGQFVDADYGLVKYKNDGTFVWDRRYANSAGSDDILTDMALDTAGNIYVTGWETSQFNTNYNFMTLKYDSAGTFKYELIYSDSLGVGPDYGWKIALDSIGNIYVMGDANENCFGNTFVNGYRWNTQVMRYGQGIFSSVETHASVFNEIKVYPNPSTGIFNMEVPVSAFGNTTTEVTIYDLQGREILKKNCIPGEPVEINELSDVQGMLIFVVQNERSTRTGRIVLQQ